MLGFYDMIDSRRDNVVGFDPHPAGYNRDAFSPRISPSLKAEDSVNQNN